MEILFLLLLGKIVDIMFSEIEGGYKNEKKNKIWRRTLC